jgi:plasmid stabilization system protein ParE
MAVVFNRLNVIEQNPERYPKRVGHYREAVIPVFPYLIIYRLNKSKNSVAVLSIFHTRRNPLKKTRR